LCKKVAYLLIKKFPEKAKKAVAFLAEDLGVKDTAIYFIKAHIALARLKGNFLEIIYAKKKKARQTVKEKAFITWKRYNLNLIFPKPLF
jgi:hypothetical protein